MLLPRATALAPGASHRWMRRAGKLGDQHKAPRATNDRALADALAPEAACAAPPAVAEALGGRPDAGGGRRVGNAATAGVAERSRSVHARKLRRFRARPPDGPMRRLRSSVRARSRAVRGSQARATSMSVLAQATPAELATALDALAEPPRTGCAQPP